jgi:hypothetical protein
MGSRKNWAHQDIHGFRITFPIQTAILGGKSPFSTPNGDGEQEVGAMVHGQSWIIFARKLMAIHLFMGIDIV